MAAILKDPLIKQYTNSINFLTQRNKQLEQENSDLIESNKLNKLIIADIFKKGPIQWQNAYSQLANEFQIFKISTKRIAEERDYYLNEV